MCGTTTRVPGGKGADQAGPRQPEFSATCSLAGAGISRSASVGFRCAVDPADDEEGT